MVSQHIINIILKAEDQISQTVKKVQSNINQLGETSQQSMNTASSATDLFQKSVKNTEKILNDVDDSIKSMGQISRNTYEMLTAEQKKALLNEKSYEQIVKEITRAIADRTRVIGTGAANAANQLQQMKLNPNLISSMNLARIKVTEMGTDISSMRGKIKVLGNAVQIGFTNKWNSAKIKISEVAGTIKSKIGSAIDKVKSKVSNLSNSFNTMGGMIASAVGAMGVNSINDLTVGLSLSREKMSSLNTAIMGSKSASDSLMSSLDTMTNTSVVGMDEMVNALNKIKLSTSMSNEQLNGTKEAVMKLGEASILMGNDTATAGYQMGEAYSGLNGDFQILKENFGITKEKMQAMGWTGEASDVEGYTRALNKCLGQMGDIGGVMNTTSGSIEMVKKRFRVAGRQIGDELTPYVKQACDAFLQLDRTTPNLTKHIIGIGGAFSAFATVAPYINDITSPIAQIVQDFSSIKDGATSVGSAIKKGFGAARTAVDLFRGATDLATLSEEGNAGATFLLSAKQALLTVKTKLATAAQWFYNVALGANPINAVVLAIVALVAILVYLYFNNEQVHDSINALFSAMSDFGEWLQSTLVPIWNNLCETLQNVYNIIVTMVIAAWTTLMSYLQGTYDFLVSIPETIQTAFTDFLDWFASLPVQIMAYILLIINYVRVWVLNMVNSAKNAGSGFVNGVISWISTLPIRVWTWIISTANRILAGATLWVNYARSKASSMVNAVITFVSRLPSRVARFISNTAGRILSGASAWVNNARSKASSMVNAVINQVSTLPNRVGQEFLNIGTRIMNIGGQLVEKARNIGRNIVNGLLDSMGIHSPGIIQNKVVNEFQNTLQQIAGMQTEAEAVGASIGDGLVDSFSSFELPSTDIVPDIQPVSQPVNVNTKIQSTTTTDSGVDSDEQIANQQAVLQDMVANVSAQYNQMKSIAGIDLGQLQLMNTNTFNAIKQNEMLQMNLMAQHINTSLLKIISYTQTSLGQASKITQDNLKKMQNSTTNVTKAMVRAWNSMKNSIISAARSIKNDSTTHFNSLANTIGSFYKKLQNPSLWGAGPSNSGMMQRNRHVGRPSSSGMASMSKILANSIRRENNIPQYISTSQAKSVGISQNTINYNNNHGKINITDLIRSGLLDENYLNILSSMNKTAGSGWDSVIAPNVQKIKDTANNWSMKGPSIHTGKGNIDTGLAFKVKDFIGGTPHISFDSFKKIGEALFRAIPYDHYCDSEKYGSWQNAIAAGACNCSDGADALLALARTCGFSGEKVHCYWDGEGHFCTRINGEILDTTAMQQRGMWVSPAVTGYGSGPAPKNVGRKTVARSSGFTDTEEKTVDNGEFTLNGELTVNHVFEGLPDGIDEETVVAMIQETATDENWIKSLVNNMRFQIADSKAKTKFERKHNRSRGIT